MSNKMKQMKGKPPVVNNIKSRRIFEWLIKFYNGRILFRNSF